MRAIPLSLAAKFLNCLPVESASLVQGYCVDSRHIKKGDLFFALKGERTDGHFFLEQVSKQGAVGAVVSESYNGNSFGLPLLRVLDPLNALQDLARLLLASSPCRIIGITGSLGKTSTKEFVKALLETKYRVAASPGNSNSQIGVPLAILNHTDGSEELVILEMGMTEKGHIARLVEIAPPEVAVLTTVALVHACNFASIDGIASAKGEIFSSPSTKIGILHHGIHNYDELCRLGVCNKISFSTNSPEADFYLSCDPKEPFEVLVGDKRVALAHFPVPGIHNRHNLLAAVVVARHFGVDWGDINRAIATMTLPDKRLQFINLNGIIFINDSYNAAEVSVKAALSTLPMPQGNGRKIAVLGSMMELGSFSEGCHQRVGEFALNHVERIYCLGEECQPIYDVWRKAGRPVHLFTKREDLVRLLSSELQQEDVVLLKGSRSKELWKILEAFSVDAIQ